MADCLKRLSYFDSLLETLSLMAWLLDRLKDVTIYYVNDRPEMQVKDTKIRRCMIEDATAPRDIHNLVSICIVLIPYYQFATSYNELRV